MKKIRAAAFSCIPYDKSTRKNATIVGIVSRPGNVIEGILSANAEIDGTNATEKLANAIKESKYKNIIRIIFLKGLSIAGLNIIDIKELSEKTNAVVVAIVKKGKRENIKKTLESLGQKEKIKHIDNAGEIYFSERLKLSFQVYGTSRNKAERIIKEFLSESKIPEPLRIARMIAKSLKDQ